MARSVIHNQDVFFQRMKKKPALQAILDNLSAYTVEDLNSLPDQPLWIREALVKLHSRGGRTSAEVAEQIADAMQAASAPTVPSPSREVREWRGADTFLGGGLSGDFAFEIQQGDLILLLPPRMDVREGRTAVHYEAKVAYSVIKLDASQWPVLLSNSTLVGTMTVEQYNREVQRRLVVKYG
jgi:hypothetical protein